MTHRRSLFFSGIVFLVAVATGGAFVHVIESRRAGEQRRLVAEVAAAQSHWLQRQLDRSLSSTLALASLLRQTGKIEDFDSLAADIIKTYGGIGSLQLAPDGVVTQIYPIAGNEAAIGQDLLNDPERQSGAWAAVQSRELTLTGPLRMIQGGIALIGRQPVFIPDGSGGERFWGFTIAVIPLPDLVAASKLSLLTEAGYEYELARIQPHTEERIVFVRSSQLELQDPVTFTLEVPNGQWTLSVAPTVGWHSPISLTLEIILVVVIGLLAGTRTYSLARQPEKLRREVDLRTRELAEINQRLEEEVNERKRAEAALQQAHDVLETRVQERTAALLRTNAILNKQLTERQKMEDRIRHRLVVEEAVARASRLFLSPRETDLTEVLQILGEAVSAHRAYIFAFRDNLQKIDNTHEWCAPDTEPQIENLQGMDAASFPWWMSKLTRGENIVIPDVAELPAEAEEEKATLEAQGIRSLLCVPIRSAAGELLGFLGLDDVEMSREWPNEDAQALRVVAEMVAAYWDRRRAEHALRESEERYRSFFEDDLTGDFISTPDGRIVACNPAFARILGFRSVEEAMRADPRSFYPKPQDRDAFIELLRKKKKLEDHEMELRRRDGKTLHVIENVVGKFDDSGELVEVKGYLFDNTERKELEEQLRQSQKMEAIGRLAGGIAHDFNNLLTAVMGYAEILSASLPEDDPLRQSVDGIKKAANRAGSLTRQLLAFSRRQLLQPEVLDLNVVVGEMEQMLRRLIGEDVELVTVCDPDLGCIKADPGQIELILMNLAINARDAMPNGGQLTVETANVDLDETYVTQHVGAKVGPHVLLSVSDTGCGMDPETVSHIFEPFFTTKEKGKGTGLGLSTVYGIVQQSGGHIWVYSEPDRGSTFRVYLPRIEGVTTRPETVVHDPKSLRGTETILLVEDEDVVREMARQVLVEQGYTLLEARDGPEALEICGRNSRVIDLMVTDVIMPHMSGRELAEKVKRLDSNVKVLYVSGYTDDVILYHGILDTGTAFLQKPFTPEALARKVREVLDGVDEKEEKTKS